MSITALPGQHQPAKTGPPRDGAKAIYYPKAPHGIPDTHRDQLNSDLLAFLRSCGRHGRSPHCPGPCCPGSSKAVVQWCLQHLTTLVGPTASQLEVRVVRWLTSPI